MLIRKFGANMLNKGDTTFIVAYCKHAILALSFAILVTDFWCCLFYS